MRRRLLAWFATQARDLPWRQDRDPYHIWVSEVMLQQTQVVAVIPYYHRFLQRFPNLNALASAPEQDVLRLWEGLGYYRRARDLHRSARLLCEQRHATIPDDAELLRSLPGFGRYTTNAVLSQAYERRLPILEANSRRVLCRLFGIDADPRLPAVEKTLWQLAEELLPRDAVGNFNQALMELGALLCSPTNPDCPACPLQQNCRARRQGRQHEIPLRARPADIVTVEEVAVVLSKKGKIMLVQRPPEGRWASMWEVPHHPRRPDETPDAAGLRLLVALRMEGDITREIMTIRHTVTRFNITMTCLAAAHIAGALPRDLYPQAKWVRADELSGYPLSVPQRKLARKLLET